MKCCCDDCGHFFDGHPIGGHRIYCGDATDADAYHKVSDGKRVGLCLTDPPYGIDGTTSDKNNYLEFSDTRENLVDLVNRFMPLARGGGGLRSVDSWERERRTISYTDMDACMVYAGWRWEGAMGVLLLAADISLRPRSKTCKWTRMSSRRHRSYRSIGADGTSVQQADHVLVMANAARERSRGCRARPIRGKWDGNPRSRTNGTLSARHRDHPCICSNLDC